MLELVAYGSCKRVALDVPKLGDSYLGRVNLQCRSHRREEKDALMVVGKTGGMEYEMGLVLE